MINLYNLCTDFVKFAYMALPPRDQRHQYLRFEGLEYIDADITDFEERLGKIYGGGIHRVLVLDFECLPAEMAEGLTSRMLMEHRDAQGQSSVRQLLILMLLIACSIAGRSQALEKICEELDDTWAWVSSGPESQPNAATSVPMVAKGALDIAEGAQAILRVARLEEEVHGIRGALGDQREVLDSMARDFSRFTTWTVTSLSRMMDHVGVRYTSYSDFQIPYVRRTRRRTNDASTLAP
ncbi:hypothetical protein Tco_0683813 [Tanacetum coccineum]